VGGGRGKGGGLSGPDPSSFREKGKRESYSTAQDRHLSQNNRGRRYFSSRCVGITLRGQRRRRLSRKAPAREKKKSSPTWVSLARRGKKMRTPGTARGTENLLRGMEREMCSSSIDIGTVCRRRKNSSRSPMGGRELHSLVRKDENNSEKKGR